MIFFFFFISKVLPFRDLRISLSLSKAEFLFLKPLLIPHCCNFCFSSDVVFVFFFPVSACVLTQSRTVTHAAKHTTTHPSILSYMRHAQPDSWPRPPGGEDGALSGASRWRRWTWLLSTESRHSYTMGPFTHMSDSVADWGRGTLVAPSRVGGPQNCDGSWFISVHN